MMSVLCLCDKHRQYYSRLLSFTNIVSESSEWNSGKMERERERERERFIHAAGASWYALTPGSSPCSSIRQTEPDAINKRGGGWTRRGGWASARVSYANTWMPRVNTVPHQISFFFSPGCAWSSHRSRNRPALTHCGTRRSSIQSRQQSHLHRWLRPTMRQQALAPEREIRHRQ